MDPVGLTLTTLSFDDRYVKLVPRTSAPPASRASTPNRVVSPSAVKRTGTVTLTTEVTTCATLTFAEPEIVSLVAITRAEPGPRAVTRPSLRTSSTPAGSTLHVKEWPGIASPLAFLATAVKRTVSYRNVNVDLVGVTRTDAT